MFDWRRDQTRKQTTKIKLKPQKRDKEEEAKGKKASGDETRKHSELSKKILLLQK